MIDPYVYPGTNVLRNKLDIRDAETLRRFERNFAGVRSRSGVPTGNFDLDHLQAIHKHLFQDMYEWAGEIRKIEMCKEATRFQRLKYIQTGMGDIYSRVVKANYLRNLGVTAFSIKAAEIIGDINHVHPFRDGNGRTQLQYLSQLAKQAQHPVDLKRLVPEQWIAASKEAQFGRYEDMTKAIRACIRPREKLNEQDRGRQL